MVWLNRSAEAGDVDDDDDSADLPMPPTFKEGEDGRSINPYIDRHISADLRQYSRLGLEFGNK